MTAEVAAGRTHEPGNPTPHGTLPPERALRRPALQRLAALLPHLPFALLLLWCQGLFWATSQAWPRPFDDPKNLVLDAGALVLVVATAFARTWRVPQPLLGWPLALYAASIATALAFSRALPEGVVFAARLALWGGAAWSFAALDSALRVRLLRAAATTGAVVGALAWWTVFKSPVPPRFVPPIGYMNYLSEVCALLVPAGVAALAGARSPRVRTGWALVTQLLVLGAWMGGARAALLALCVFALAFAALSGSPRSLPLRLGGAAALILLQVLLLHAVAPVDARGESPLARVLATVSRNPSSFAGSSPFSAANPTSDRLHIWKASLAMIADRPLGIGPGTFRFEYPDYAEKLGFPARSQTWLMHPHNELLAQGVECGVAGALAFACLLFLAARSLWRARRSPDAQGREALAALTGLLTAAGVWSLGNGATVALERWIVALYLAPALVPLCAARAPSRPLRAAALALVAAASVVALGTHVSQACLRAAEAGGPRSLSSLELAHALAPGTFDASYRTVLGYWRTGRDDDAQRRMDEALQRYPNVPSLQALAARLAHARGDGARAYAHAVRAVELSPEQRHRLRAILGGRPAAR